MSPQVSAFVICCNEEDQIERCLRSISWCDEIIIIDSGSTDRTLEIASRYTDKIFFNPWSGFVAQKRFGLGKCSKDWVLNIDADEEVSEELSEEIQEALATADELQINGFHLSRVVFFLGRWWRYGGWYPEYRLRLCRKVATQWGGGDPHEKAIVSGATKKLTGELRHFTYEDLAGQMESLEKFSSTAAQTMFNNGEYSSVWKLILRPTSRFFKFFFIKQGFREGLAGFIVAGIEAHYVFMKYAKLWELRRKNKSREISRL